MAFNVTMYTFAKRRNSTATPPESSGESFSGEIKEDFTPLALSLTFKFLNPAYKPRYNYARIEEFSRYYYITDWVFVGGLWRGKFAVDVLATYKTEILATRQYVTRCSDSTYCEIIDTARTTVRGSSQLATDITMTQTEFWGTGYQDGVVVVGIINSTNKKIGAVTYYAMSQYTYAVLLFKLLSGISWAGISTSEISEELQKALVNPLQYIVSAVWLPKNAADFVSNSGAPGSDIVTDILLGWWSFNLSGNTARILHNPFTFGWDDIRVKKYIEIPKHPQRAEQSTGKVDNWLDLSPYSRYTLTFLPFGSFDLDSSALYGYSHLGIECRVHAYTGDATLTLTAARDDQGTGDKVLSVMNANCGIPLPVGQIAVNIANMDSALMSAAIMGATEIASNITSAPAVITNTTPRVTSPKSHTSHTSTPRISGNGGR